MDQVKGRKDAARRDAKPWENFGQQDTDPYREDVGKLGGAVRTELSKPGGDMEAGRFPESVSILQQHAFMKLSRQFEPRQDHFQRADQYLRANPWQGAHCVEPVQ